MAIGSVKSQVGTIAVKTTETTQPSARALAQELAAQPPAESFESPAGKKPVSFNGYSAVKRAPLDANPELLEQLSARRVATQAGGAAPAFSSGTQYVGAKGAGSSLFTQKMGKPPKLIGTKIGDVKITRSLSPPEGQGNRMQAIALARLSGSPNAAVIEKNGRFFAVVTDKKLAGMTADAVPVAKSDEASIKAYQELSKATFATSPPDPARLKTLAAMGLGVPEGAINMVGPNNPAQPNAINISLTPLPGALAVTKTPIGGASTVVLGADIFGSKHDPLEPATILFHESVHVEDHVVANSLTQAWEKETGTKFSPATQKAFDGWLTKQYTDKKITGEELALGRLNAGNSTIDTETRAHVRTFMAAFKNNPAGAQSELEALAGYRMMPSNDNVNALARELKAFQATLTPTEKKQFEAMFKAAKLPTSQEERKEMIAANPNKKGLPLEPNGGPAWTVFRTAVPVVVKR